MDTKQQYKKTHNALFIYFILLIMIATYFFIWKRMSNIYKNNIINNDIVNISYKNIKTSGFPFKIKFTFNDATLKIDTMLKDASITTNKLIISNVIFSNKLNIETNAFDINLKDKKQTVFITENKNNDFSLTFDKKDITDININFALLKIIDSQTEDREFLFKNVSFKQMSKKQDINNSLILNSNIDNIITLNTKNNEEIANFSFKNNITFANDIYEDVVLNSSITLDDIMLYNLKDNYYLKLNGDINLNMQKQQKSFDILLKVFNSQNIKINEDNDIVKTIKITLNEINKNEKNTENEIYFHLTKKADEEEYYLNNENLNDILLRVLPIFQNLLQSGLLN